MDPPPSAAGFPSGSGAPPAFVTGGQPGQSREQGRLVPPFRVSCWVAQSVSICTAQCYTKLCRCCCEHLAGGRKRRWWAPREGGGHMSKQAGAVMGMEGPYLGMAQLLWCACEKPQGSRGTPGNPNPGLQGIQCEKCAHKPFFIRIWEVHFLMHLDGLKVWREQCGVLTLPLKYCVVHMLVL